jgi:hypothetical protein
MHRRALLLHHNDFRRIVAMDIFVTVCGRNAFDSASYNDGTAFPSRLKHPIAHGPEAWDGDTT